MSGTNDNLRNALKLLLSLLFTLIALSAFAIGGQGPMEIAKSGLQNKKNPVIDKIGIEENLGAKLDLSTEFTDEFGNKVKLGKYFNEKPVFMMLIYYECPTLCSLHLNAVLKTLKEFEWTIGQEFEFVVISIDPDESPKVAEKKLEAYHKEYDREGSRDGWHFLTGKEENIKKIEVYRESLNKPLLATKDKNVIAIATDVKKIKNIDQNAAAFILQGAIDYLKN